MVDDHNNGEARRHDMSWASSLEPLTDRKFALPALSAKLLEFWFDGDSSKVWSLMQTTKPKDELAYLTPVCLMSNKDYDMFMAMRAKTATYLIREQQLLGALSNSRQQEEASVLQVKKEIWYPMADGSACNGIVMVDGVIPQVLQSNMATSNPVADGSACHAIVIADGVIPQVLQSNIETSNPMAGGSACNAIVMAKEVIPQVLQPNTATSYINFSQNIKAEKPWMMNQIVNSSSTESTNDLQAIAASFSIGSSQDGKVKVKKPRGRPPRGPKTSAATRDQTTYPIQIQPVGRTSLPTRSPRAKKSKTKASSKARSEQTGGGSGGK